MKKLTASKTKNVPAKEKVKAFPIVAIGASAGGLEAIRELLESLSPDTGMAFIYVQHLSPDYKSALPEILSRATKMKVQAIEDMVRIQPDNIYIIPPNKGICYCPVRRRAEEFIRIRQKLSEKNG